MQGSARISKDQKGSEKIRKDQKGSARISKDQNALTRIDKVHETSTKEKMYGSWETTGIFSRVGYKAIINH